MEVDSVWDMIFTTLTEKGIDVYPPATKTGECTSPYVVIKDEGVSKFQQYSSTVNYYSLLCYVPKGDYSTLKPFVDQIKGIAKLLEPMILPTYVETPSFYDDTYKGHMISVQYKNTRKI